MPETTDGRRRAAALLAGAVAAGDLLQVALLSWRPKHVGALAGALVYAGLALAVARGSRVALWIVAAMPLLPLTVLALAAAGAPLPVAPDAGMLAVLVVQLLAAGAALLSVRARRASAVDGSGAGA